MSAGSCGADSPTNPSLIPPPPVPAPPVVSSNVLVGAGDIGRCGVDGARQTGNLLDQQDGVVIVIGDAAYEEGTAREYRDCYAPFWGRHLGRTYPVPGNHDYYTGGAAGYFGYFGSAAGEPSRGYYSYQAGTWLVVALNTNIPIGSGSPQYAWLAAQLRSFGGRCVAAYMHHPRFTSGPNGDNVFTEPLWNLMYDHGVEFVLSGHDHIYERFAQQDTAGRVDVGRGLRQYVVGTGGGEPYPIVTIHANSQVRYAGWGIIRVTLDDGRYTWQFISAARGAFSDTGSESCH